MSAPLRLLLILPAALTKVLAQSPPVQWLPAAKAWDRSLGTHRVVLQTGELPAGATAVTARMEWRRPDAEPEKKAVLVYDLKSGRQVTNVSVQSISGDAGEITFEPVAGAGEYAV